MSNQKHKLVPWSSYNNLCVQIWQSTQITEEQRAELSYELQTKGRRATPEVARRFKDLKRKNQEGA